MQDMDLLQQSDDNKAEAIPFSRRAILIHSTTFAASIIGSYESEHNSDNPYTCLHVAQLPRHKVTVVRSLLVID